MINFKTDDQPQYLHWETDDQLMINFKTDDQPQCLDWETDHCCSMKRESRLPRDSQTCLRKKSKTENPPKSFLSKPRSCWCEKCAYLKHSLNSTALENAERYTNIQKNANIQKCKYLNYS